MTTVYRDMAIRDRLPVMGKMAEERFKAYAEASGVTWSYYGIDGPPLAYIPPGLPLEIRTTPDFLCAHPEKRRYFFVDAKGTGHDGVLKVKPTSLIGLSWWNDLLSVYVFVYDQSQDRVAVIALADLKRLAARAPIERFAQDGNRYHPIPHDAIPWRPNGEAA